MTQSCSRTIDTAGLVHRFVADAIHGNDLDLLDTLIAPDHVSHCPGGDLFGPDGVRLEIVEARTAFPDLRIEIADLVAGEMHAAVRFTLHGTHVSSFLGFRPSGTRHALPGMIFIRFSGDRFAESWTIFDVSPLRDS